MLNLHTRMKTNKSFLKRIRITKNGKMIRRVSGQNHYNAKESRRRQRRKNTSFRSPRPFKNISPAASTPNPSLMTRVKRGVAAHKRREKILKYAKGFKWSRGSKERMA